LATPALLLFADIIGRLLVPGELRVSVVSAFIGAPVLIFLVRRIRAFYPTGEWSYSDAPDQRYASTA
ncbi:iron chelate uptake ABC transporter family permease subunit, partial [Salmonella enterica subsp. enterica serovar Cerro]|nr:iron chelate uptake ABC transporter family permease subunit [Salmonella enterica subsp. enterica serovar Cerro]